MNILNYTLEYLEKKFEQVKINKLAKTPQFWCPMCHAPNCQIIPHSGYKLICHKCGQGKNMGTIIDVMDKVFKMSEDDVVQDMKKVLDLEITTHDEQIDILDFYKQQEFDMVPIARNQKIPIEKEWPTKFHKDKEEWANWLGEGSNIGLKTGKISNVTVIDVDQNPVPEEMNKYLKNCDTLHQTTNKGHHFIFKYEDDLPKTRIEELKVDIENNGGQVVIAPSEIDGKIRIINRKPVLEMPIELKKFLLSKIKVYKPIQPVSVISSNEAPKHINLEDFNLKSINEGNRHNIFMHFGGILRKNLNVGQTKDVLSLLNRYFSNPPLSDKEFNDVVNQLDKYMDFDDKEIAQKILAYLRIVEDATARDVREALGFKKERIDRALSHLIKEEYLIKKRRLFHIIKTIQWKDTFMDEGKKIDFSMPYFDDHSIFRNGDMVVIGAKQKVGKCFKKDTEILMVDGSIKKIQDIRKNELIMGPDSKSRKVLKLIRGKEKLYKISYNFDKNSYTVCENHLLSLKQSGKKDTITISLKDFLKKNKTFQLRSKLYTASIDFPKQKLELDPYFLGLWLGDGSSDSVGITSMDKEVVKYIYEYAKKLKLQVSIYNKQKNKAKTYAITTGKVGGSHNIYTLRNLLKDLNLLNNKHIPEIYKISSKQQRLQLLAGLIDTDGSKARNRTVSFCNKNKQIIDSTVYISRSLGFRTTTRKKYVDNKLYYVIRITGDTYLIPTKIKRKKSVKCSSRKNSTYYGFKITPLKEGRYYGFTVDKDNLFLTADFIVQHNSHIALNIIKRLIQQGKKPYYINLESGNRFAKISRSLGIVEGSYWNATHFAPEQVKLERNAITIIDWLLPDDYAGTDKLYKYFAQQLVKNDGILIIFVQLKNSGEFFAPNMIAFFPAFVCRYFYTDEDKGVDGKFVIDYMREPKFNVKKANIPCKYDWESKELKRIDELDEYS